MQHDWTEEELQDIEHMDAQQKDLQSLTLAFESMRNCIARQRRREAKIRHRQNQAARALIESTH